MLSLYRHPETAEENIYLRQELLKIGVDSLEQEWPEEWVFLDGRDSTMELKLAWAVLLAYAF